MNWMHAFFGLGVAIGPLIMTAVLSAGLGLALGVRHRGRRPARPRHRVRAHRAGLAASASRPSTEAAATRQPVATAGRSSGCRSGTTLRLPAVWSGTLAFALYVAIEVSAGLWAFLLLTEGRGLSAAVAGGCVSALLGQPLRRPGGAGPGGRAAGRRGWCCGSASPGWPSARSLIAVPGPAVLAVARPGRGRLRRRAGVPAAHPHHRRAGRRGARGPGHRPPDRRRRASARRSSRPGSGVLIGNTSVQVLGPALLVLALALIALYERGARRLDRPAHRAAGARSARRARVSPTSGPVRPVVEGR